MVSCQVDDLLIEIEALKGDLSEAREIIDYYEHQQKVFIEQMAAIVIDYQAQNERNL